MSIAFGVNAKVLTAGAGTQGATSAVTTQATGSTFVQMMCYGNFAISGPFTDNFSNTYTQVGTEQQNVTQGFRCSMFYCTNGVGGANHVWTQPFADRFLVESFYVVEITGAATATSLDVVAQGNTTTPFNFPQTITNANDALLSIIKYNATPGSNTANGGFAILDSTTSTCVYNRLTSATGAYDPAPTITTANASAWISASFKEASGAAAFPGPMYYQRKVLYFI